MSDGCGGLGVEAGRGSARRVLAIVVLPSIALFIALYVTGHAARASWQFYLATFVAAALYFVVAARAGGLRADLTLKRPWSDLGIGALIGAALLALFLVGALIVRDWPLFAAPVHGLLDHARGGIFALTLATTVINGVGEELFFRGAVMRALPGSWATRATIATLLYVIVTAAMGVPLLAIAAVAVGVPAHLEARRTGALISAMTLHAVWAAGMLVVLPALI